MPGQFYADFGGKGYLKKRNVEKEKYRHSLAAIAGVPLYAFFGFIRYAG